MKKTTFLETYRKINSCKARIYTHSDSFIALKRTNNHSHDSEKAKIKVTKIKARYQQTLESTSILMNECTSDLQQAAKVMCRE